METLTSDIFFKEVIITNEKILWTKVADEINSL